MQLKGLVKFFTAALILISLYQLSFTFIVRNVEKRARSQAKRAALAENPQAKGHAMDSLIDAKYEAITDSLQGETVFKVPLLKKYTYQEAKEQELNLGLDQPGKFCYAFRAGVCKSKPRHQTGLPFHQIF